MKRIYTLITLAALTATLSAQPGGGGRPGGGPGGGRPGGAARQPGPAVATCKSCTITAGSASDYNQIKLCFFFTHNDSCLCNAVQRCVFISLLSSSRSN